MITEEVKMKWELFSGTRGNSSSEHKRIQVVKELIFCHGIGLARAGGGVCCRASRPPAYS